MQSQSQCGSKAYRGKLAGMDGEPSFGRPTIVNRDTSLEAATAAQAFGSAVQIHVAGQIHGPLVFRCSQGQVGNILLQHILAPMD